MQWIINILEDDEDESMHSGADADALKIDISFSQENSQTSSQMYPQWQPSSQDENSGNKSQPQNIRTQEQQSSQVEMKEDGCSMKIQTKVDGCQTPSGPHPPLHRPVQVDGEGHSVEPNSGEFSQYLMPMQPQISGTTLAQAHRPSIMLNRSSESQFSNVQSFSNQQVPVPDQGGGTSSNRANQMPFAILVPIILPHLDKDRAMQLTSFFEKLRQNEISRETFYKLMISIVGANLLRLAATKMGAKSERSRSQQAHPRLKTGTAAQFSDPYSFGQLYQKSHSTPALTRTSTSTMPQTKMSTISMQHTPVPWQVRENQTIGASSNMSNVKQESSEQALENQPKPQPSLSRGPIISSSVLVDQGESLPVPSHDEVLGRHNHGTAFPTSLRTENVVPSASIPSPMNTDFQVSSNPGTAFPTSLRTENVAPSASIRSPMNIDFQSISVTPASCIESNSKASAKKPSIGLKKPLDPSPSLPSKKQKFHGAFSDQSIEHLNDVTAVSGINLREEEEQLFSGPQDDSRVSEASHKAVQEEKDRLILQKVPLQKKLAEIMTKYGLKNLSHDVERCLSLCVEERLRGLISSLIRVSKQRADFEKSRHGTVVTSDVREQILAINRKAREEWDKKQVEAEKLRKQNEQPESSAVVNTDKEKDKRRPKSLKIPVNKEEDDKLRTTAANVAARVAVGGADVKLKWDLMVQARQKRDMGPEILTSSQAGKDAKNIQSANSVENVKETRGTGQRDLSTSGLVRQGGRSQVAATSLRVAPPISIKDVIAVLEKEPQMAKSTIMHRIYEKMHADPAQAE